MATYYFFNTTMTSDWNQSNNWYNDEFQSSPAYLVPTSTDDAVIKQSCTYNGGSTPTINSLVVDNIEFGISINVTTTATFNSSAFYSGSGLYADTITFNNTSYNRGSLYPTTMVYFNDYSVNGDISLMYWGYIYGSVTFNFVSYNGTFGWIQPTSPSTVNFEGLGPGVSSYNNNGIITGSVSTLTFNSASYSVGSGGGGTINISGDIILNGDSKIEGGTINASSITFNNSSYSIYNSISSTPALLYTTATFNNSSYNGISSYLYYSSTFNDSSYQAGGGAGFSPGYTTTFNGSSHNDTYVYYGDTIFNDTSYNNTTGYTGYYTDNTIFNEDSFNLGTAGGTVTWDGLTGINAYGRFTGGQSNPSQAATFYYNAAVDYSWQTAGNWWIDSAHSIAAPSIPITGDDVVLSNYVSSNMGSEPSINNLIANGPWASYFGINITITGLGTFNAANIGDPSTSLTITGNVLLTNSAFNYSLINGNATFDGGFNNGGTITGISTFSLYSAEMTIRNAYSGTYGGSGDVRFKYEKGVNGSSILGIV